MKSICQKNCFSILLFVFLLGISSNGFSQDSTSVEKTNLIKSEFWKKVRFGGGLGLSIGSGYTNISVAPSAIYDFNQFVSLGFGIQGTYIKQKNFYNSFLYGASLIGLFNPIQEIQLSTEIEQLKVNTNFESAIPNASFWNTALFIGAGYRTNNITIGARYNVLHNDSDQVYTQALIPFVRVYF